MNNLLPYLIMAVIANILVLYFLLNSIIKADRRDKYLRTQINILSQLAKKSGVSIEELENCFEK